MQAVGARQIQDSQQAARTGFQAAFFSFDGNAGVVRDLLAAAGQQIE